MSAKSTTRAAAHSRAAGLTDHRRITEISDDEIAAAVVDDPDAAPLDIDWSAADVVVPPRKVPVSIRLDADILDYFRSGGAGYQGRINAVLRSYMKVRGQS